MALDNVITLENAVIGVDEHIILTDVNLEVGRGAGKLFGGVGFVRI